MNRNIKLCGIAVHLLFALACASAPSSDTEGTPAKEQTPKGPHYRLFVVSDFPNSARKEYRVQLFVPGTKESYVSLCNGPLSKALDESKAYGLTFIFEVFPQPDTGQYGGCVDGRRISLVTSHRARKPKTWPMPALQPFVANDFPEMKSNGISVIELGRVCAPPTRAEPAASEAGAFQQGSGGTPPSVQVQVDGGKKERVSPSEAQMFEELDFHSPHTVALYSYDGKTKLQSFDFTFPEDQRAVCLKRKLTYGTWSVAGGKGCRCP